MVTINKISKIFPFIFWPLLFVAIIWIYWPSFNNFFSSDDFFNLSLAQANTFREAINFFNIFQSPANFPFYRPLTIQFYFWLFFHFFGFNPLSYHLINFSLFCLSAILMFIFIKKLSKNYLVSYLSLFFYVFSSSHFNRLYWISLIQEIVLINVYLLSLIFFVSFIEKRKLIFYFISLICFPIVLTTKETAVMLPFSLVLVDLFFLKKINLLYGLKKDQFIGYLFSLFLGCIYWPDFFSLALATAANMCLFLHLKALLITGFGICFGVLEFQMPMLMFACLTRYIS